MSMLHLERFCQKNGVGFSDLGQLLSDSPVTGIYGMIEYGVELGAKKEGTTEVLSIEDIDDYVGMDQERLNELTSFIGKFLGTEEEEEAEKK